MESFKPSSLAPGGRTLFDVPLLLFHLKQVLRDTGWVGNVWEARFHFWYWSLVTFQPLEQFSRELIGSFHTPSEKKTWQWASCCWTTERDGTSAAVGRCRTSKIQTMQNTCMEFPHESSMERWSAASSLVPVCQPEESGLMKAFFSAVKRSHVAALGRQMMKI